MSKPRNKPSLDTKHIPIKLALIDCGYHVWDCGIYGRGMPDLLVMSKAKQSQFVFLEVKSPKGKLRDTQVDFFEMFACAPVYIVRSAEEALAAMGIEDER